MSTNAEYPRLPEGMHPDLAEECRAAYMEAKPYTRIRPLREGVDDPQGAHCDGSQGNHHLDCPQPLVAVQYTTAFGDPAFYCEEHALLQNEWDNVHYYSVHKPRKLPAGWQEEIDAMMARLTKKDKKKKEAEEIEPS